MRTLNNLRRLTRAAHICSNQCWNANTEMSLEQRKEKPYYLAASQCFDEAWADLPLWLRKLLTKDMKI